MPEEAILLTQNVEEHENPIDDEERDGYLGDSHADGDDSSIRKDVGDGEPPVRPSIFHTDREE